MDKAVKTKKKVFIGLSPRLRSGQAGGVDKRVFVGLSGGVDSSVAAALLKQQGYSVAGVFMRFWKDGHAGQNACCSVESEVKALAVAKKLGIPFYIFNFEAEFKKAVVDYFLTELAAGRTPNPCVVCNPQVKFGLFLARAIKMGADYVSTGHYARVAVIARSEATKQSRGRGSIAGSPRPCGARDDTFGLFTAKDKKKDQSYFLYRLNQKQLSQVIFPLGGYTKDQVYELAKQWRLPHQSHQSFDICFAGDYQAFLKKHLKLKPGKIVFMSVIPAKAGIQGSGSRVTRLARRACEARREPGMTKKIILGTHQGLPFYTIGQRASIGGPGPFFVVEKDSKKNLLFVSNNENDLYQKEMSLEKINWLSGQTPRLPLKCKVKIRYSVKSETGTIRANGSIKKMVVLFEKAQRAITPGQSAVFYGKNGEVLGGGVIEN